MFSSSGQGQTSYVPSEGISCKELAASGNEHLLKPGGENRHGDGVDDNRRKRMPSSKIKLSPAPLSFTTWEDPEARSCWSRRPFSPLSLQGLSRTSQCTKEHCSMVHRDKLIWWWCRYKLCIMDKVVCSADSLWPAASRWSHRRSLPPAKSV